MIIMMKYCYSSNVNEEDSNRANNNNLGGIEILLATIYFAWIVHTGR